MIDHTPCTLLLGSLGLVMEIGWLVGWSLTSLFSTNMAISETSIGD